MAAAFAFGALARNRRHGRAASAPVARMRRHGIEVIVVASCAVHAVRVEGGCLGDVCTSRYKIKV